MTKINTEILDAAVEELRSKSVGLEAAGRILPELSARIERIRSYGNDAAREKAEILVSSYRFLDDAQRALRVRFDTAIGNAARAKKEAETLIAAGPLNMDVLGTRTLDVLTTQNQKLLTMARGVQKLAGEIEQHIEKAADLETDVLKLEGKATSESKLKGFLGGAGAVLKELRFWSLVALGGAGLFYGGPLIRGLAGMIPRRKEQKATA